MGVGPVVLVQREELSTSSRRGHVVKIKCPARPFGHHRAYVVGKPQCALYVSWTALPENWWADTR